ncbi:MAG TPA: DUF4350 domain-containing protein [Geobacteraceae bacterium]|nr:DUF4350 domain-containing protein [Geobacteraceae bacterium]
MSRIALLPSLVVSLVFLGFLAVPAHARPTVLFDQGHGQRFVIERNGDLDLSRFAALFKVSGYDIAAATDPLTTDRLTGINALVLSGAFRPYSPEEIEAIAAFVDRGGALCIMLHIGPPLSPLLRRFGVEHSNGVIREKENIIDNNPVNFQVTRLADHPLVRELHKFSLNGVWALNGALPGIQVVARTSPAAWIDLNGNGQLDSSDAQQSFAVAVAGQSGNGRFVVFGDDAIFQNRYLVDDNLILSRNLAIWLAAGTSQPLRSQSPSGTGKTLQGT